MVTHHLIIDTVFVLATANHHKVWHLSYLPMRQGQRSNAIINAFWNTVLERYSRSLTFWNTFLEFCFKTFLKRYFNIIPVLLQTGVVGKENICAHVWSCLFRKVHANCHRDQSWQSLCIYVVKLTFPNSIICGSNKYVGIVEHRTWTSQSNLFSCIDSITRMECSHVSP